jgi:spore germination cell wall hydrolase CwlJ-like protein
MIKPDPALDLEHQSDEVLARLACWGEARGEGPVGMLAVRYVIGNRARLNYKTVGQVILQPKQFSSFNKGDPNREKLLNAPETDPVGYAQADAACELYQNILTVDPTHGSTNYFAHALVSPSWGPGNPRWVTTAVIGRHTFGRAA